MNFLAHLLAGDSGESLLVGSFAGDFCRGRLDKQRAELRAGIRLHRMIDGFAEEHESFSRIRARLRPSLGLYSGVGADMLIDHLLAHKWSDWVSDESLEKFSDRVGAVLVERSEWLPPDGARVARMMVAGKWLESYASEDGIRTALEKMTMRTRGNVKLSDTLSSLDRHQEEIGRSVKSFLGDLFSSRQLLDAGMRENLRTG